MTYDSFLEGDSFLHRLDARARLLGLIPMTVAFFLPCPLAMTSAAALAVMAIVLAALGPRELLLPLRALAPVLALLLVLTPLLTPGGDVLVRLGGVRLVTTRGLAAAALMTARFLGVSYLFFGAFRTMSLDDFVLGLRWMGLPYAACLVAVITLRMIPSLAGTWRNVVDAHRLRGGGRRGGGIRRWLPLLTSVLVEAVRSIPELAMTLESRGFGRGTPRTSYLALADRRMLARDIAVVALVSACFLVPSLVLSLTAG